jgi:hypothetical protein
VNDIPEHAEAARPAVIVLAAMDNVAVTRRNIAAGETLVVDGEVIVARADLSLGHKMARRAISLGTTIVKYGMPIGSATADIQPGDWVHLHNMQSNYFSTQTRALKVKA